MPASQPGPLTPGPSPTTPSPRGPTIPEPPAAPTPAVAVPAAGAGARRLALEDAGRLALPALAFAIYVASIAGSNWMISHVGRSVPGAHELPVGFGLEAPSGVYLAGLTFVARDIVQRLAGTRAGLAAIVLGALVSWRVSSASLALASGGTFLLSESCDFAVYTPLQQRHFPLAVLGSGLVSDAVDSTVFLTLAGIPLPLALPGQLVGKAWLVLAGGLVAGLLRRAGPFKSGTPPPTGTGRAGAPAGRPPHGPAR